MSWVYLWWFSFFHPLCLMPWYLSGRAKHRLELFNNFTFWFSWSTFSRLTFSEIKQRSMKLISRTFCGDFKMAFCHSALTERWTHGVLWLGKSLWFGPLQDRAGRYDSGKEIDVNLIHIYKKTFLKCTSVCAIFLPVCFTLLDYGRSGPFNV